MNSLMNAMYVCMNVRTYFIVVGGVKLHESGWALLVTGSRLYLWRYSTNQLTVREQGNVCVCVYNYMRFLAL